MRDAPHLGFAALLADALTTLRDTDAEAEARDADPVGRLAMDAAHQVTATGGRPYALGGAAAYRPGADPVAPPPRVLDVRFPAPRARVAPATAATPTERTPAAKAARNRSAAPATSGARPAPRGTVSPARPATVTAGGQGAGPSRVGPLK